MPLHPLLRWAITFDGRAPRWELWAFHLAVTAAGVVIAIGNSATLSLLGAEVSNLVFAGLFAALLVVAAVPYASLFIRRLHDLGYAGGWALILFTPLVGALLLFRLFFTRGVPWDNPYGPPPTLAPRRQAGAGGEER